MSPPSIIDLCLDGAAARQHFLSVPPEPGALFLQILSTKSLFNGKPSKCKPTEETFVPQVFVAVSIGIFGTTFLYAKVELPDEEELFEVE